MLEGNSSQPQIVDLQMSVEEYLDRLSWGRDPVKERRDREYELELIYYGIPLGEARNVAPLFEKSELSLQDKILISKAIRQIWEQLQKPLYAELEHFSG